MTQSDTTKAPGAPWLTGGAIWALAIASAALNVWGWMATSSGLIALVLAALVLSAEVLGLRLAEHAAARAAEKAWLRLAVAVALFFGVVAFNAVSGHRALSHYETLAAAPAIEVQVAREAAEADVARLEAAIAGIPALRGDIPRTRLVELRAARDAELARLEPQVAAARAKLAALPAATQPPQQIGHTAILLMVLLIEALKALGLFATSRRAPAPQAPAKIDAAGASTPASELARKRWRLVQEAKAAKAASV